MKMFRADLHVHTVLSPCGSLEMSPVNIVEAAQKAKLDVIGITDHNSTKQAVIVQELGAEKGLTVLCGAEVNTLEEVHCLAFFETIDQLKQFQQFLDKHLIVVKNKPEKFGYQVVVDRNDVILEEEPRLLISALNVGINEVEKFVHSMNGLFIPAHIDRMMNGIISHLGFIPSDLVCDAFGLSVRVNPEMWKDKVPAGATLLRNSDAHHPSQLGSCFNFFEMEDCSFSEIRKALHGEDGHRVVFSI
jgi:3',5'-nucleoside bisphosphate phosphatase